MVRPLIGDSEKEHSPEQRSSFSRHLCLSRDEHLQKEDAVAMDSPLRVLLEECAGDVPGKVKRVHLTGLDIDVHEAF